MKKIVSTLMIFAMTLTSGVVYADNTKDNLDDKLQKNRREQVRLDEEIKAFNTKIEEAEKDIENKNNEIEKLNIEVDSLLTQIENLENDIERNEELLGERLKIVNSNYSMGYINVILSSNSISDFFNNIYVVKQVVEQDKELLKELDNNKEVIEEKKVEIESKKKEQENLKTVLENNMDELNKDKEELQSLRNKLEKEENDLEDEISKLTGQSVIPEENLGVLTGDGSWPVPGYNRVSSPYGYRTHPIFNTTKMHTGIDIPAPTGTPIVSIDNGKVIFSGVQRGYGNTVMIQHDDGKVSLYAHNSVNNVSVGQRVVKGQIIAKIGSTGYSTGPHIHFEIRVNGKHVNPMPYI